MSAILIDRTRPEALNKEAIGSRFAARTVLFNDDEHSFEEVALQLMKAIRCSYAQGLALANQVHNQGAAIVYAGHLERCEAVAAVLNAIALRVEVQR